MYIKEWLYKENQEVRELIKLTVRPSMMSIKSRYLKIISSEDQRKHQISWDKKSSKDRIMVKFKLENHLNFKIQSRICRCTKESISKQAIEQNIWQEKLINLGDIR